MNNEFIVVSSLVVLSIIGMAWPKISSVLLYRGSQRSPDKFQKRMDLVNDLLDACEGCEDETKAVQAAGDIIAKHWREDDHE